MQRLVSILTWPLRRPRTVFFIAAVCALLAAVSVGRLHADPSLTAMFSRSDPSAEAIKLHLTAISIIGQVIHHRCARTIISELVGPEAQRYDAETVGRHIADFSLAALGLSPAVDEPRP